MEKEALNKDIATVVGKPMDFATDLNAMHEAEKVLRNQFTLIEHNYWNLLQHVKPHPIYASALERATALCAVLHLHPTKENDHE